MVALEYMGGGGLIACPSALTEERDVVRVPWEIRRRARLQGRNSPAALLLAALDDALGAGFEPSRALGGGGCRVPIRTDAQDRAVHQHVLAKDPIHHRAAVA